MDSDDSDRIVTKKNSKKAKKVKKHKKKASSDSSDSDSDTETKKRKKSRKKSKVDDKENSKGSSSKKLKKEIKYDDEDGGKVLTKKESNSSSKTEVNSDLEGASWELPDFFEGKNFYIYGDYEKKTKNLIGRYIIGFGGHIEEYMGDKVDFVITDKGWNDEFKKVLFKFFLNFK